MRRAAAIASIVMILLWLPATAMGATSPTPSPTPTPGSNVQQMPDESSSWADSLTVIGFTVVAMGVLVLFIRAGMRASTREDDADGDQP